MVLRNVRRMTACLVALVACGLAPSGVRADTQILVQEVDGSGNVIAGTTQIFASSTNITTSSANFATITITANPSSGAVGSLTTTINATPISMSFNPSIGIKVTVTSDGYTTPNGGGNAVVRNNVAASAAIGGGQNMLSATTQLITNPLTTPPSSGTAGATGDLLGAATGLASDVRPDGSVSQETTSNVVDFPGSFAIQQVITARAINVGPGGIASGSTLGGSASSLVTTAPVPAPGGLALALIGLPLIGLRRALRKAGAG